MCTLTPHRLVKKNQETWVVVSVVRPVERWFCLVCGRFQFFVWFEFDDVLSNCAVFSCCTANGAQKVKTVCGRKLKFNNNILDNFTESAKSDRYWIVRYITFVTSARIQGIVLFVKTENVICVSSRPSLFRLCISTDDWFLIPAYDVYFYHLYTIEPN